MTAAQAVDVLQQTRNELAEMARRRDAWRERAMNEARQVETLQLAVRVMTDERDAALRKFEAAEAVGVELLSRVDELDPLAAELAQVCAEQKHELRCAAERDERRDREIFDQARLVVDLRHQLEATTARLVSEREQHEETRDRWRLTAADLGLALTRLEETKQLAGRLRQRLKDATDMAFGAGLSSARSALGIRVVEDPAIPPGEAEMRTADQRIRIVNLGLVPSTDCPAAPGPFHEEPANG
jgi:hypothetical protein